MTDFTVQNVLLATVIPSASAQVRVLRADLSMPAFLLL